jgi:methionyl-tRNA formyltransferase
MISPQTLKIGFLSSSDFCIPIVAQILEFQGKTVAEVLSFQNDIGTFTSTEIYDYSKHQEQIDKVKDLKFEFCIVVSQPDGLVKNKLIPNAISTWAHNNNITLWNPVNINQEVNKVFETLDIVIAASFGQLISQKLLDKPKYGYINWHPSLLPKYRGPTPMQSTILNQEAKYGLSWITMTKAMDAGKILLQLEKALDPNIDFKQMANELGELGSLTMFKAIINQILNIGNEQNLNAVTFCSKVSREDQLVNTEILTATEIKAHHKSYIKYPGTVIEAKYFGGNIKILDCNIMINEIIKNLEINKYGNLYVAKIGKKQIVFIQCKDQTFLEIKKIINTQGKQIDLTGYQFKKDY